MKGATTDSDILLIGYLRIIMHFSASLMEAVRKKAL